MRLAVLSFISMSSVYLITLNDVNPYNPQHSAYSPFMLKCDMKLLIACSMRFSLPSSFDVSSLPSGYTAVAYP